MNMLEISDFNSVIEISIGVSMAYIIIRDKTSNYSFFSLLSKISTYATNLLMHHKTKKLQREESIISQINFFNNSGKLPPETKGALTLISDKAKEVVEKVNTMEISYKHKLSNYMGTNYLCVSSFDSFVFGFVLLFVGPLQQKGVINYGTSILFTCLLIQCIGLLHCIIFDVFVTENDNFFRPTMFLHGFLFLIAVLVSFINFISSDLLDSNTLIIVSVVACFINFVLYFVRDFLVNIISFLHVYFKISFMRISKIVKDHYKDLNRFESQLKQLNEDLQNDNAFASKCTISADINSTSREIVA